MHILFLSDNFPPEVNAPASRTFDHCREWVAQGHRVTVVTCAPNFPAGKLIGNYRNRMFAREQMNGIEVVRVWSYITANEGFLRRTLDYVSYAVSATLASLFVRRVDVIVATSPQFFTACAGWATSVLKWRPYVFELRDIWPESIRAVGAIKSGALLRFLERLELFLYRRAAAVISVTRSFKDNLAGRGIDPGKIEIITNGANVELFTPRPKDEDLVEALGLKGKFVAGYVGTHGMAHALGTVIAAADMVSKRVDDVHFLMLGDGAEKDALKADATRRGLTNMTFLDTVPKHAVVRYWSLLDAAIVHLRDEPLFREVIPSKIFESMAMGVPILHGVRGESAQIVTEENVGVTFAPEDPGALAEAVIAMSADPEGRRAMVARGPAAARKYDRKGLANQMLATLQRLASERLRRPA